MKLSEIKQILGGRGIQLTKSLGQNFLHDGNQLRRILAAAMLEKTDKVLEIGPGLGPLTELLIAEAGQVLAIEKDARLVEVLKERFHSVLSPGPGQEGLLELIHEDALDFLKQERRDWSGWKLVANLPYSVASPILVELAYAPRGPERMVATLQLEVANRLMARPADDDYGLLTVLVQLHYEPLETFKIPASCFFPEPDVDSACISLARRRRLLAASLRSEIFIRVVKCAFSQRRKMMFKLLRADWDLVRLQHAFQIAAVSPLARAETVSVEQFARLAEALSE